MNFNSIRSMKKALDVYSMRNQAINNNLANVDTPKYKRQYVRFEEYLSKSREVYLKGTKTNSKHFDIPAPVQQEPVLATDKSYSTRLDGNNVNADVEAAEQVKNQIMYNAVVQRISGVFQSMKTAINEGGK